MESSNMKNMVVLKNLPSNMVEEAIIIFKETQRVKQKECIEKSNTKNNEDICLKSKEYILKEAEMLVADYIAKLENSNRLEKTQTIMNKKYRKLQKYNIVLIGILIITIILNFL